MGLQLLRDGLLEGLDLVDAGAPPSVVARCTALGATVHQLDPTVGDEALAESVAALPGAGALVAAAGLDPDPAEGLARLWEATRAVVAGRLIPAGAGRVLLIGPAPGAAGAAELRAALDNLVRTTAVEWSRHGICVVALLPGDETDDEVLAELVAFLLSPAGAYVSGTSIELDGLSLSR
ncbi:unannotated protein [freshwater metagenome]|uniref:Unannotated protein n=1 Tax=freshwater metagenome TaxID=449393 RepID=A0A6J7E8S0_9ZZZZ|nr:hypothetical protein [Actinomycetota bacterium]